MNRLCGLVETGTPILFLIFPLQESLKVLNKALKHNEGQTADSEKRRGIRQKV